MAATSAIIGKGTTIGYGDTSGGSFTLLSEVVNVGQPEISIGTVEATHYTSDNSYVEKKSAVWKEPGEVAITLNYVKGQTTTLYTLVGVEKWFKITKPDGSTYVFYGVIVRLGGGDIPNKDIIRQSANIQILGPITFTAAA